MSVVAAAKQLTVRIHPAPLNIRESTEVFKYLKTFGDVEFYRLFRHEITTKEPKNEALVIYKTPEAMRNAFAASPMTFSIPPPSPPPIPTEGETPFVEAAEYRPPPNLQFILETQETEYDHAQMIRKKLYSASMSSDYNTSQGSPPGVSLTFNTRTPKGHKFTEETVESRLLKRKLEIATGGGWFGWREELKKSGLESWKQIAADAGLGGSVKEKPDPGSIAPRSTGWGITWENKEARTTSTKESSHKHVIARPKSLPGDPTQKSATYTVRTPLSLSRDSESSLPMEPIRDVAPVSQELSRSSENAFRRFTPGAQRQRTVEEKNSMQEGNQALAPKQMSRILGTSTARESSRNRPRSFLPSSSSTVQEPSAESLPRRATFSSHGVEESIDNLSVQVIGAIATAQKRSDSITMRRPRLDSVEATKIGLSPNVQESQYKTRRLIIENAPQHSWTRKEPTAEEKALLRQKAEVVKRSSLAESQAIENARAYRKIDFNTKAETAGVSQQSVTTQLSFAERLAQRQAQKNKMASQRPSTAGQTLMKDNRESQQTMSSQLSVPPPPPPPPPAAGKTLEELLQERTYSVLKTTSNKEQSPAIVLSSKSALERLKQLEANSEEQQKKRLEGSAKDANQGGTEAPSSSVPKAVPMPTSRQSEASFLATPKSQKMKVQVRIIDQDQKDREAAAEAARKKAIEESKSTSFLGKLKWWN